MIIKIIPATKNSASFPAVGYNTGKLDKNKGELMKVSGFGPLEGLQHWRPEDYRNYLKAVSATNKAVKLPQFHAVISADGKSHDKQETRERPLRSRESTMLSSTTTPSLSFPFLRQQMQPPPRSHHLAAPRSLAIRCILSSNHAFRDSQLPQRLFVSMQIRQCPSSLYSDSDGVEQLTDDVLFCPYAEVRFARLCHDVDELLCCRPHASGRQRRG